jgi:hypothetical protein
MKKIKVNYLKQICNYILLETPEDIFNYFLHVEKGASEYLNKIIKSKIPVNRWDHSCSKGHGESIFTMSVVIGNLKGINPIYLMDNSLQTKMQNFYECLEKYGNVIVNSNGGYCHLLNDMELIEEKIFSFEDEDKKLTYTINKNTQYINLENDPELEEYTKDFLNKIDNNFSYILNLRKFSVADLIDVFNEFQENGGHTVYLYTTALDIPQMFDYSEALIKSNLKKIIFNFNAGLNDEILTVINYLEKNNISVDFEKV